MRVLLIPLMLLLLRCLHLFVDSNEASHRRLLDVCHETKSYPLRLFDMPKPSVCYDIHDSLLCVVDMPDTL